MSSTLRKTDESELQERNGQDHQRTFDPIATEILGEILIELKAMRFHLATITEEYYDN